MVSQEELEVAIARYKSRQGEAVPQAVEVGNAPDDLDEPSYPAMVEVADDGARTPVPPHYSAARDEFAGSPDTANRNRPKLPPEAYRSDSELKASTATKGPTPYTRGAPLPRGNDEPTTVGSVASYMPEMLDSGVVELDGQDDDKA